MVNVRYDAVKNRIYAVLEGASKLEEVKQYNIEFMKAVDKAKPGFTYLCDLSKRGVELPECTKELDLGKEYAMKKGIGKFAFVIDGAILKMQLKRAYGEEQSVMFATVEEAEKYLGA